MNQKTAKALRKLAKYECKGNYKTNYVMDFAGMTTNVTVTLGPCMRSLYQHLKKQNYKYSDLKAKLDEYA